MSTSNKIVEKSVLGVQREMDDAKREIQQAREKLSAIKKAAGLLTEEFDQTKLFKGEHLENGDLKIFCIVGELKTAVVKAKSPILESLPSLSDQLGVEITPEMTFRVTHDGHIIVCTNEETR